VKVRSERFATVPQVVVEQASGNAVKLYAILYGLGSFDRPERSVPRPSLAEKMSCSVDTVDRLLRELVNLGAIEVARSKRKDGSWGPSTYLLGGGRTGAATSPQGRGQGGRTGADSSSLSSEVEAQRTTDDVLEKAKEKAGPDGRKLVDDLVAQIISNGSRPPKPKAAWYDSARLLLTDDGVDPDLAEKVLRWCQQDDFWSTVVLSMPKFREKYDQLRLAMKRSRQHRAGVSVSDITERMGRRGA